MFILVGIWHGHYFSRVAVKNNLLMVIGLKIINQGLSYKLIIYRKGCQGKNNYMQYKTVL